MQNTQAPNTSPWSLQQRISVFLVFVIILLTVVLSILIAVQFQNPLINNLVTIFGLVGTAIGILSLPFFKKSLHLLGQLLHNAGSTIRSRIRRFTLGFISLIKQHLPPRWNYILIVLSLATTIFSFYNLQNNPPSSAVRSCQDGSNTLQITKEGNGEYIGLSNGCQIFTSDSISNARQAETDIYKNNPSITKSHITLVISTMLSGSDTSSLSSGTSLLQGADVAQQEYNTQVKTYNSRLKNGKLPLLPLRLLVANMGSNEGYATTVARQIAQLSQYDHSIIGVMGWPFSTDSARDALQILDKAHIPSVSPSLSGDLFTNISSYFFRVIPPDAYQASAGASFLEKQGIRHVIVCIDYRNDYSSSLASNFIASFSARSGNTAIPEQYTRGMLSQAEDPLGARARELGKNIIKDLKEYSSALKTTAVYFAGYANDLAPLKEYLSSGEGFQSITSSVQDAQSIIIMGGDGLDEYGANSASNYSNYQNIYFTTFSSYQIWKSQPKQPCLLTDYQNIFNPYNVFNRLGYTFAENDAILAYDSVTAFLVAYTNLSGQLLFNPTPDAIKNQLTHTRFLGVSGQITLGPTGDPKDKAIYINQVTDSTTPAALLAPSPATGMLTSTQTNFPLCGLP